MKNENNIDELFKSKLENMTSTVSSPSLASSLKTIKASSSTIAFLTSKIAVVIISASIVSALFIVNTPTTDKVRTIRVFEYAPITILDQVESIELETTNAILESKTIEPFEKENIPRIQMVEDAPLTQNQNSNPTIKPIVEPATTTTSEKPSEVVYVKQKPVEIVDTIVQVIKTKKRKK